MATRKREAVKPRLEMPAERGIVYGIRDNVAGMLIGGLYVHKHEAAAIRFFSEAAKQPDSMIGKYPADFDLVKIGYIDNNGHIYSVDEQQVIHAVVTLSGASWAAAQVTD